MTNFIINDELYAVGEMSMNQELVNGQIVVNGVMQLDMYIPDIKFIKTDTFGIFGVNVLKESFGTSDKNVIYHFTANSIYIDLETFNSREE